MLVLPDVRLKLLALLYEHAAHVGTATVSEAGPASETEAVRGMLSHDVPEEERMDLVFIRTVVILGPVKYL